MTAIAEPITSPPATDLELHTILEAWNTATQRLQQTHELLRAEVKRLTDELEAKNRELARKNRLADLGQMASHVAHEVRNGLVPMKLYLNLLRRRVASDQASAHIADKIAAGFTGLESVVNDLLHFTAHRDPRIESTPLAEFIRDLCESLAPKLAAQAIELVCDVPLDQALSADLDMLRRALLNLMLNAVDAMPQGGRLTIAARVEAATLRLEVADTGPGLPPDTAERIFEPFFTTKNSGTGLGLAIVERIAQVHGGTVAAENHPAGGAVFTLQLPHNRHHDGRNLI